MAEDKTGVEVVSTTVQDPARVPPEAVVLVARYLEKAGFSGIFYIIRTRNITDRPNLAGHVKFISTFDNRGIRLRVQHGDLGTAKEFVISAPPGVYEKNIRSTLTKLDEQLASLPN